MAAPPWRAGKSAATQQTVQPAAPRPPELPTDEQALELVGKHFTWQCGICLERQPLQYADSDTFSFSSRHYRCTEYLNRCIAARTQPDRFATESLTPMPGFALSSSLLSQQVCRDCGAPGFISPGCERNPIALIQVLLAQAFSAGSATVALGSALHYMRQHNITLDWIDSVLQEAQSAPVSPSVADVHYLTPRWCGPALPCVGVVYHPGMTRAHAAPSTYPWSDRRTAEEEKKLAQDDIDVFAMTNKPPKPRQIPDLAPERPDRVFVAAAYLATLGILQACQRIPCKEASDEQLALVVAAQQIENVASKVRQASSAPDGVLHTGDTYWCSSTLQAARLAAGGVISAVQAVLTGTVQRAMALVRPPGHHAASDCSRGFCIANNIAAAAKVALCEHGLQRILIVDWDIHHGDGTEALFYDDPRVLVISVHRYDDGQYYPGSGHASRAGAGSGLGYNINIPLNGDWIGDNDLAALWSHVVMPVARCFDPQLVLVSAGWDAARGDFLGDWDVTPAGFAHLTHQLLSLAGGKIVLAMEGGYNLKAIATSTASVMRVLLGEAPPPFTQADEHVNIVRVQRELEEGRAEAVAVRERGDGAEEDSERRYHKQERVPCKRTWDAIREVAIVHSAHWPVLAPLAVPC